MPNDEFTEERPPPADPAALAEAQDIISNPQNPRHQSYQRGDKFTADHIDSLYKRAYPGEVSLGGDPPELQEALAEPVAPPTTQTQPATQPSSPGEDDWSGFDLTPENMESILRVELGDNFDSAMKRAPQAAVKLFGDFPDQVFVKQLFALAGNHPSGYKLILHLDNLIRKGGR